MVRKRVEVALCDYCHRQADDVERRRLVVPRTNRQLTFDACEDCRTTVPLAEWEKLMPKKPKTTRGSVVVSVEEVERLARKRPRARKKAG